MQSTMIQHSDDMNNNRSVKLKLILVVNIIYVYVTALSSVCQAQSDPQVLSGSHSQGPWTYTSHLHMAAFKLSVSRMLLF